jgi:hypothetical protein
MTHGGSQVAHNRPDSHNADEFGQVLPFRHRPSRPPSPPASHPAGAATEPADDLAQFEQEPEEPVDYRQRALMNVIALAIVTLLVGAGVWIADTIVDMQNDQDCVMQGRGNCAPIEAPALRRQ